MKSLVVHLETDCSDDEGLIRAIERLKGVAAVTIGTVRHLDRAASVDQLRLSVRAANCLYNLGVRTVGDLVSRTRESLLKTKNLGRETAREIEVELARNGYKLAERAP